tara:strand:- start:345 stop:2885 length:2541 start_codon:yes stop_codon:yes gene_type:complete
MSDYGINLKLNLEGNNKLRTLYQDFKNLETQINKTQQTIKELTRKNQELKLQQSNLGSAIVGVGKGAEVTVKFIQALAKTFFENKKAVKESNKEVREAKRALKELKEEASVVRKNTIDNAKAFQQNSGILKESTGTLRRYIEEWERLRATTRARDTGTKNTLIDSITKADFTLQFKQLDNYVKKINRVADAYRRMAGGNDSVKFGAFRGMGNLLGFDPGKTESGIKRYIRVLENLRKQLDRTGKEYREVTARIRQMNRELEIKPGIATPTGYTADQYGPRQAMFGEKTFARMTSGNKQFQRGGMFYEPGGYGRRRSGALNSALIGGAFPALFGQGLGASIGGGLGGGVGGMLGGGLGFGLSLVGTQLGAQVDKMIGSLTELGQALRNPTENIELFITKIGQANTPFSDNIETLKKLGLEGKATELVLERFNKTFGTNRKSLEKVGTESIRFQNELQKLGTSISLFLAGPLASFLEKINEALGITTVSGLRDQANAQAIREKRVELGILAPGGTPERPGKDKWNTSFLKMTEGKIRNMPGVKARQDEIFEQLMNDRGLGGQAGTRNFGEEDMKALIAERRGVELSDMTKQLDLERQSLTLRSEDMAVLKARIDLLKIEDQISIKKQNRIDSLSDAAKEQIDHDLKKLDIQKQINEAQLENAKILASPVKSAIVDLEKEIRKLNDAQYQMVELSTAISSSFSESFRGIIQGTMSVQDAFRNMFNKIADHFLDMAARMAAAQLQQGLLSMFPNIFKPAPIKGKAEGGPVKGGTPYVVGEEGPELFVPGSSGNIVPNHDIGGSTNIVVNVDASGSAVQGDAGQAEELGSMLAAAVQAEIINQKRPGGLLA